MSWGPPHQRRAPYWSRAIDPVCKNCGETLKGHANTKCLWDFGVFDPDIDPDEIWQTTTPPPPSKPGDQY